VLDRRIGKWAASGAGDGDAARSAREAARRVVAALAESGAVDDQAFAQIRGASLRRAGKSTRAIGAHLSAKGVPGEITAARNDKGEGGEAAELGAAAVHLRRRRLGAFRTAADTPQLRKRELALIIAFRASID
jgi:regulatory protein